MSSVLTVEYLPVLSQAQYGDLPLVPSGTVLMLSSTPWQKAEPEFMAAALIQYCIEAGEWKPVPAGLEFDDVLKCFANYHFMGHAFWNGLGILREIKDVEVVEYKGGQYIVPMPLLASKALGSGSDLRYAEIHVE